MDINPATHIECIINKMEKNGKIHKAKTRTDECRRSKYHEDHYQSKRKSALGLTVFQPNKKKVGFDIELLSLAAIR